MESAGVVIDQDVCQTWRNFYQGTSFQIEKSEQKNVDRQVTNDDTENNAGFPQEKDSADNNIEGTEDTASEMQQGLRQMEPTVMTIRERSVPQMTIHRPTVIQSKQLMSLQKQDKL